MKKSKEKSKKGSNRSSTRHSNHSLDLGASKSQSCSSSSSLSEGVLSWPTAFSEIVQSKSMHTTILKDCAAAATARAQLSQGEYSNGRTFWVGAADALNNKNKNKTTLEKLALSIFYSHCSRRALAWSQCIQDDSTFDVNAPAKLDNDNGDNNADETKMQPSDSILTKFMETIDLKTSGAEWWTLYMDSEDSGVGWHWDKDYHAELEEHLNIHPVLGTVSYFSEIGAPTVVIPKKTAGSTVSTHDDFLTLEENRPLSDVYLSRVVPGKHMSFDGRFLHSAPIDLYDAIKEDSSFRNHSSLPKASKKAGQQGKKRAKRATFLVNIWIDHKPRDAVPIDDALESRLSKLKVSLDLSQYKPASQLEIQVATPDTPMSMMISKDKKTSIKANNNNATANANSKKHEKSKGQPGGRTVSNETNAIRSSAVQSFRWELTKEFSMIAEMPVKAIAEHWTKSDTIHVQWTKGTQRPYIEEELP